MVQVPTTLLAMLDSSVGGKTAIDAGPAKNAIGTYHHPAAVLVDPELLATLPRYQRIAGLAEGVKAAAVRDDALFAWIEEHATALREGDVETTGELIARGVRIKARVVSEDPAETGVRAILNFGHTFGHALESATGFAVLHGEAVAAGMRMEARLGESVRVTEAGTTDRLEGALSACGLPEVLEPPLDLDRILDHARVDKKARAGDLRWVLLRRVGEAACADDGAWTHPIPLTECRGPLAAALRKAFEAADSPA